MKYRLINNNEVKIEYMEILSLGEKIKRLRKENDLTLKDLAGERITPGQISLVESGKSNPSMDLLEYLAQSLNTTVEYLMESEETQAEKICNYFENIAQAHIMSDEYETTDRYLEESMYYAEQYNLEYRKANNYYLKGLVHLKKKEMTLAQQFFLSANAIFIKRNHFEKIIETFLYLGKITYELKAYHSSITYFQQAEKIFNETDSGNDFLKGKIYYYLANVYNKLEMLDKAINYTFLATEKFKQLEDKQGYARSLILLSKEYMEKKNIDDAIKYSKRALDIYNEINDLNQVSDIENNLGKLYYQFENLEESFEHYNKAKEIRYKNNKIKFIETLMNICDNYIKLKNVKKCDSILQEIDENIEFIDDNNMLKLYLLKYRVSVLTGDSNSAENNLLLALSYADNREMNMEYGQVSVMIGNYYINCGKENEAAVYLKQGLNKFEQLGLLKEL